MTYPPQQPGPGGWGQQPGNGFPPPGPQQTPQQQPNWYGNQHTGWDQQPGQPAPMAPWGGDLGPGNWVQEPGGFGDVQPPAPKKSKLPWILGGIGALVVLAGVGAGLFLWLGGGPGEARPVAQAVVDKVNAHDFAGLDEHLCQSNRAGLEEQLAILEPGTFDVRLGAVTESGEQATAELLGTFDMGGATHPVDQTMGLVVEDGAWKICQLEQ